MSRINLPEPLTPIADPVTLEDLEQLRVFHGKHIRPEMVGIHASNSFSPHNSASRGVMMSQHLPQHLVTSGLEKPYVISGPEYRLSDHTFRTEMPVNGHVVAVINRYTQSVGRGGVKGTPERTIIFMREDNAKLDVLHVREWTSLHQYFGFRNKITPMTNRLRDDQTSIPKGFVFADTPAVTDDGCYCVGGNFETAFFDRRATAEDGAIVSEDALKRMEFSVFEEREFNVGSQEIPLNTYGTDEYYKIFPDIGEEIRADGLVMASRPYGDRLSVAMMTPTDLREAYSVFDQRRYSREAIVSKELWQLIKEGKAKARCGVIRDIQIIRNNDQNQSIPKTMTEQMDKYADALIAYYSQITAVIRKYESDDRRRGGPGYVPMTPKLQNLAVRAMVISSQGGNRFSGSINLQHNRNTLDEYNIKFVIEHVITPNKGFKLSDLNGSKSVIVSVRKKEDMPRDASGRYAEIVVASNATIDRSNWGRNFGPYFAASARDMTEWIRAQLNMTKNASEEQMMMLEDAVFNPVYERLLKYYQIVSPHSYRHYKHVVKDMTLRRKHVLQCVNDKVTVFMPIDNPIDNIDAVLHLEKHFPQTFGKVIDREEGAEPTVSENDVRIHPVYYMVLDKIADQGSATSVGKLQHHGLLASQTRSEKHTLPYRPGPTRTMGEMEGQIFLLYAKTPHAVAEMHDLSNNPLTMRTACNVFLRHDTPTNIPKLINRDEIPYGGGRPLQFLQHFLSTQGAWIEYMPEKEAFELGMREVFEPNK